MLLGFIFKKSISGKKSFKKSLGDAFLGNIENEKVEKPGKVVTVKEKSIK